MAKPILMDMTPRDPRAELRERLERAPIDHAEALLEAYEVLQGLHDRGVLDLLRGALGSSDKVLQIAVDAAGTPESIRALRNLLLVVNLVGSVDPQTLARVTSTVPAALNAVSAPGKPRGLWELFKAFVWDHDVRRGLSTMTDVLKVFGSRLGSTDPLH